VKRENPGTRTCQGIICRHWLRETTGGKGDYEWKGIRKPVMQAIYIYKEMSVKERKRVKIYLADAHQGRRL